MLHVHSWNGIRLFLYEIPSVGFKLIRQFQGRVNNLIDIEKTTAWFYTT